VTLSQYHCSAHLSDMSDFGALYSKCMNYYYKQVRQPDKNQWEETLPRS